MKLNRETYKVDSPGSIGMIALVIGIIFLALSGVGYAVNGSHHFYLTYLVGFMFWLAIALGGFFFTMIHHITGANWSTVIRRVSENIASTMPLMLIFFIPIVFGSHDLFEWTHQEVLETDPIIQGKSGYLNLPFFYIRAAIYFIVWIGFSYMLRKTSLKQDAGHSPELTKTFKKISAPGILLFAITTTFASFDWLMSLDPHWFSTIFGVYIFAGSFLAFLSFLVLVLAYQRRNDVLKKEVTVEHLHDIGKITFGFIIFWAYMAFSQYFLIWYANLPEENYWFLYRWDNSWEFFSLLLIFGHFVFPFIALITRATKRMFGWMVFMSVWILLMRFVDLYWLALPTHYRDGMHFSIFDIAPVLGIGGIFFWYFWRNQTSSPVLPVKDPTLKNSMEFVNS